MPIIQPSLRRGRIADRVGMLLLFGMLAALIVSVLSGFSSLQS
jgi:hypothetical protein